MQLQAEAKETKDQVTLFMIIAVLQTNLCVMFVSVFGISWSEFKFVFLVTGGRGYNGQMQPGVFHGYPLKSPKVQGVTLSCCVIQTLHSSTDIWCVHGYHSNVFCGGFTDVCLWAEKGFLMTTKNRTLLPLPSARRGSHSSISVLLPHSGWDNYNRCCKTLLQYSKLGNSPIQYLSGILVLLCRFDLFILVLT